jgi:hypothetical protein
MLAQAYSYEEKYAKDLSEFFQSTEKSFTEQPFIGWAQQVREKYAQLKEERASN